MDAYQLANGKSIFHLNKYETDFTYKEIFEDKIYNKHGLTFHENACIFDVGANIGLFSIFIKQEVKNAQVFAFEPAPHCFEILEKNVADFGDSVKIYHCGLGAAEGKMEFTYYPNYTIMSGFYNDIDNDSKLLSASISSQLKQSGRPIADERFVEYLMRNKLENPTTTECEVRTISAIIKENSVKTIDLLKVDAEKAELKVLQGIEESDWSKIQQVVLEAHEESTKEVVTSMLKSFGFHVIIDVEDNFSSTGVANIYARRE